MTTNSPPEMLMKAAMLIGIQRREAAVQATVAELTATEARHNRQRADDITERVWDRKRSERRSLLAKLYAKRSGFLIVEPTSAELERADRELARRAGYTGRSLLRPGGYLVNGKQSTRAQYRATVESASTELRQTRRRRMATPFDM